MPEQEVRTVPQMGWAGIKNGELMRLAEAKFDIFVTVDRNLSYQQNLAGIDLAVVVLRARSNRLSDLAPFARNILDQLSALSKGQATVIDLKNSSK